MAKTSPEPTRLKMRQLSVEMPESGFRVVQYFNKFGIEKVDNHLLIHFGFVSASGEVLAAYSAMFSHLFLTTNRSEWLQYLGQIGSAPERALDLSWRPPSSKIDRLEIVNALRIGRSGADAEFRCYCVSMIAAIDSARGSSSNTEVAAQPLALLQTTLEQQQLLLLALVKHVES